MRAIQADRRIKQPPTTVQAYYRQVRKRTYVVSVSNRIVNTRNSKGIGSMGRNGSEGGITFLLSWKENENETEKENEEAKGRGGG